MSRRFAVRLATLLIPMALLATSSCAGAGAQEVSHVARANRQTLCPNTGILPTKANLGLVDASIHCLIDRERSSRGLQTLQPNPTLQRLATSQAREMVIGEYFGDDSLNGQTPWQRVSESGYAAGATRIALGQNIGWGTGPLATPSAMMRAWMLSPEHRHITLTAAYRDIGIGVAPEPPHPDGSLPGATYTVQFAARSPAG